MQMSIHTFLEERGLSIHDYTVYQMGSLFPFRHVFPRVRRMEPACVYEYFNDEQDGYDVLPFKRAVLQYKLIAMESPQLYCNALFPIYYNILQ
jgi:hypothetical protein